MGHAQHRDGDRDLALAAFAALEVDQLERVVELASRLIGPMQSNGIRDYLLGSVLAKRGQYEQALQIALDLYAQETSRASGERLRADTLALLQGLSRTGIAAAALLDAGLQATPVAIDPLEPQTRDHALEHRDACA